MPPRAAWPPSGHIPRETLPSGKNNKGITVGFITHQSLTNDDFMKELGMKLPFQYNSSYGFGLTTGNTYLWPKGEGWAGNRIKVGVDVRWFDVSFVKYNKYPKIGGVDLKNFVGTLDDIFGPEYSRAPGDFDGDWGWGEDEDDGYDDFADDFMDKIGNMQVQIGMGVGPSVSIAPLAHLDNAARFLRVNIYGHFDPQASVVISKDYQGDLHGSWAFLPTWTSEATYNGRISWSEWKAAGVPPNIPISPEVTKWTSMMIFRAFRILSEATRSAGATHLSA